MSRDIHCTSPKKQQKQKGYLDQRGKGWGPPPPEKQNWIQRRGVNLQQRWIEEEKKLVKVILNRIMTSKSSMKRI